VTLPIVRVILYVKDIPKVAAFYHTHFAMKALPSDEDGWLELESDSGSCNIALHRAASTQKSGAATKIVFGVADVRQCKRPGRQLDPDLEPWPDIKR
jgi:hypothetical protein